MTTLRLSWPEQYVPSRHLSEEAFIAEFEPLAERGFAGLPGGPVVVEGLDAKYRVAWRAHYKSSQGLSQLLRQLLEERASKRGRERST